VQKKHECQDEICSDFALIQELVCKDMEQHFGVLQTHWAITKILS
jgi:hypothetical protein